MHQCLQKCKQPSAEKGVSLSAGKTVERIFLESKFLLINDGRSPIEVIRQYIDSQGKKTRGGETWQTKPVNSGCIRINIHDEGMRLLSV